MKNRQESKARRAFRLKVEYLERLAEIQNPEKKWVPRTLAEFVSWTDPKVGFQSWSSFTVATLNGPNADLRRRLNQARLALQTSAQKAVKARVGQTVQITQLRNEVVSLAEQNVRLIEEKYELQEEVKRLQASLKILQERESELLQTLNKIVPVDRQLRSIAPQ